MGGRVRTYLAVALCGIACAAAAGPIAARALDPAATATTAAVRVSGESLHLSGTVLPAQPGGPVKLKVLRSKAKGAPYKRVRSAEATINLEGSFGTSIQRTPKGNCQLTATWAGDADSLPSSASVGFRC
jgi:hypothetical protein